jgi:hypothetical protein
VFGFGEAPEQKFWKWFLRHEDEFFRFDSAAVAERERLFDNLAAELRKVDGDLTFEFGPKDEKREFVISADGLKRAFPAVAALVAAAPKLARWDVIGFRPRRPPCIIEINGKRVDPSDVYFTLLDNGKRAGIRLFVPGFSENEAGLKQMGYLFLDGALGEYDVETELGFIEVLPSNSKTEGERCPLADLPSKFDALVRQLGTSTNRLAH